MLTALVLMVLKLLSKRRRYWPAVRAAKLKLQVAGTLAVLRAGVAVGVGGAATTAETPAAVPPSSTSAAQPSATSGPAQRRGPGRPRRTDRRPTSSRAAPTTIPPMPSVRRRTTA